MGLRATLLLESSCDFILIQQSFRGSFSVATFYSMLKDFVIRRLSTSESIS